MDTTRDNMSIALRQALRTILWTGTIWHEDGTDKPMDECYDVDNIANESVTMIFDALYAFTRSAQDAGLYIDDIHPADFGHDFVLTAQHQGAGFWDRGYGNLGERLTELAHGYSLDAYLGDDGRIHIN